MDDAKKIELDRHTFFAGLMLGLCAKGRERFPAEGADFHRAFLKTIGRVRGDARVRLKSARWIRMDPVFESVQEANEMLLEAEHDRLLAFLNPSLRVAQFKIARDQARKELELLAPDTADWFVSLGEFFDEQLRRIDTRMENLRLLKSDILAYRERIVGKMGEG